MKPVPGDASDTGAAGPARRAGSSSLRRGLALWLLVPMLVLVPLAAALMYTLTVRPALDAFDRGLSDTATALNGLLQSAGRAAALRLSAETELALRTDPYDEIYFVVLDARGEVLVGDPSLARIGPEVEPGQWRFADARLGSKPVRLASFGARCPDSPAVCAVRVAETVGKRNDAQRQVWIGAALTMASLALALLALGWVAIGRGLRPLNRLSDDIERRSLENLQPIDSHGVPREAAALVRALNRLLDRMREASLAQQAFLADAAHQLRTPLTALRTESELALLEPHPRELEGTLTRLHAGATRAARLANQLLSQARADHETHSTSMLPLDLKQVASDAALEWVQTAVDAGIDLGFELESAPVLGRSHLLREVLANLLHNAFEYAGRGARVTVRTAVRAGQGVLEVEDSGPGIPPDERARVLERFQRGRRATGSGSGLGLAIVRDIASSHGAALELREGTHGQGLLVRLSFPVFSRP